MSKLTGYKDQTTGLSDPPANAVAVTPNDGANLSEVSRFLMVGVGGNITVNMYGSGTNVLLPALAAGTIYPIRVSKIYATGTTATGIVSLY
jgi:hypothetical protein